MKLLLCALGCGLLIAMGLRRLGWRAVMDWKIDLSHAYYPAHLQLLVTRLSRRTTATSYADTLGYVERPWQWPGVRAQ